MMTLAENQGKVITEKTFKKLRTLDKWVYYEILDQVNDTDKNDDEAPVSGEEIVEEIKEEAQKQGEKEAPQLDPKGLEIDAELEAMHKSGKSDWTLDEIKSSAKKTWNQIWDTYDKDGENGIITSRYKLLEVTPNSNQFKLTSK